MRHLISNVEWNDTLKLLNLHDAWHYFSTTFDSIIAECIPLDCQDQRKTYISATKPSILKIKNASCGIVTWPLNLLLSIS